MLQHASMAVVCSGAGTGALLSANPRWTTPLSRGAPRSSAAASATTRLALCSEATGGRMAALGVHNSQEKEELLSQRLAIRSCRSHPRRSINNFLSYPKSGRPYEVFVASVGRSFVFRTLFTKLVHLAARNRLSTLSISVASPGPWLCLE